ncbi:MAG: MFS transporter [Chloroflexota bacterium]
MKKQHANRITNAWAMYDWANSSFATIILATLLPIYYESTAGANLPGNLATVYWGYTTSIALLVAAVISPVLGAMADFKGSKKRYLGYFAALGVTGTGLLYFAGRGDWLLASVFFIIGNVGYAGANVFYDALLPHIAEEGELDKISAKGFAMGYLGGGILLALNLAMLYFAGESGAEAVTRLAFVSVAVWWAVFSIPLMRHVPEVAKVVRPGEEGKSALRVSLARLKGTYQDIRAYRQVVLFILAVWLYTDGIGTIVKMAVIVGAEVGISRTTLVGTILLVQFVSIPFSFLFGWLAGEIGSRKGITIGLVIYMLVTVAAANMSTDWHFWALGLGIGMVQGGTQSLTRSMGARMIPKSKSGEFFGFVSVTIKFAGIAGPALFAIVSQILGNSRAGFWAILFFFIGGIAVLSQVDEEEAMKMAQVVDAKAGV